METTIIDLAGTSGEGAGGIPESGGTQIIGETVTESGVNFTGGLLNLHEIVAGWELTGKLDTLSGEADIYLAEKDGARGVIKYYRSVAKPKMEILEKIKGLNHPDIVRLYDYGIYQGRFYEIMEYAAGGALDTREKDGTYRYLPLPEDEVLGVVQEVINSFKTCHEAGIIHRDIKPANIYYRLVEEIEIPREEGDEEEEPGIAYRGSDVVIADFGISSVMEDAENLHKTQTGSRTTGYAAPEVLSGLIGPSMDYYALGITLWELLTGKDPFTLDNGKRRNDAHLIRDTIEGRIADDILSREPRVSEKMERLIRGLLVIDVEHRWGYDEVSRYLAGETVEVYQKQKKTWTFNIGDQGCSTLEDLGNALIENPEIAKRYIYRGFLSSFLEDDYPEIARRIEDIAEKSSAGDDYYNGILKVSYLLNPALPLKFANGFKAQNIDDITFLLQNAPETLVPLLRDKKSKLFAYLEIIGYEEQAGEIRNLPDDLGDTELTAKAEVLLRNKVIRPFRLAKYADFELSTLEQIRKVPKDMQQHILTLVAEKSYEGLFLPWLDIQIPEVSVRDMQTGSWNLFLQSTGYADMEEMSASELMDFLDMI